MIKVGDLIRVARPFLTHEGQMGIITKVPRTERGVWAILLTSGENTFVATGRKECMEVVNESR